MSVLLSLESSSGICSAALHDNGNLLALAEVHIEQAHASRLALLIDQVVKFADVDIKNISAVAVSSGPGSYTGLRIGTSTAKGLCFALGIPLIAVGTLDLLAEHVRVFNVNGWHLCPMIDARRMEVYCSLYHANGERLRPVEAKVIDETSFEQDLAVHPVLFFGTGASKCKNTITHSNAFFLDGINAGAATLGVIASKKYSIRDIEDVDTFEPFYLKDFMAKKAVNLIPGIPNKSEV
ncbi:MAG: tRNA (adenosine(37)-N6)-threonylcarbamoyltransferase complex dimerization subunit type 1 TsaB [Chryseolinea sp.]